MNAKNNYESRQLTEDDIFFLMNYELSHYFNSEIFWRKAFDLMRMAIETSQNPLISRKDAIAMIKRRSVDNAVKRGKLTPIKHGKYIYFDRISFYEFCRVSNLDIP